MQNVDAQIQRVYLFIFNLYFDLYLFYDWNVLDSCEVSCVFSAEGSKIRNISVSAGFCDN